MVGELVLIHNPPRGPDGRFLPRKKGGTRARRRTAPTKKKPSSRRAPAKGARARKAPRTRHQENAPRAGVVSRDVHEIRYQHAENGKAFRHEFAPDDVELIAMQDGTLRLRSRTGKPLWGDFKE